MKYLALLTAVLLIGGTGVAVAEWSDNFDDYDLGSGLHGQGGWEGWEGDSTWDAYVTGDQYFSEPHSVDINGDADMVHPFEGYTEGLWIFSTRVYVPSDLVAPNFSYFILLNTYGPGIHNWSTQVGFDPVTSTVFSDFEGTTLPLIYDRWIELRVDIDLDADWQDIYYDGALLSGKSWTDGLSGGGALNIGAVDLFAYGATSVYYDDMELIPEPGLISLVGLGLLALLRRRR